MHGNVWHETYPLAVITMHYILYNTCIHWFWFCVKHSLPNPSLFSDKCSTPEDFHGGHLSRVYVDMKTESVKNTDKEVFLNGFLSEISTHKAKRIFTLAKQFSHLFGVSSFTVQIVMLIMWYSILRNYNPNVILDIRNESLAWTLAFCLYTYV